MEVVYIDSEIDKSGPSIDIVDSSNLKKFESIDEIGSNKYKTTKQNSFVHWWGRVAHVVLRGMYGTTEERKKAALELIPLTDGLFPNSEINSCIRMQTDDLMKLYELYKAKVRLTEFDIMSFKDKWCDILHDFMSKCSQLMNLQHRQISNIKQKAQTLKRSFNCKHYEGTIMTDSLQNQLNKVIDEEIDQCVYHFTKETIIKINKLKNDIVVPIFTESEQKSKLDKDIENECAILKEKYAPSTLEELKFAFENSILGIEHDMSKQIIQESENWLPALKCESEFCRLLKKYNE